jgi:hypothetical protein
VLDFDSDAFSLLPVSFVFANLAASPLTTPAAAYGLLGKFTLFEKNHNKPTGFFLQRPSACSCTRPWQPHPNDLCFGRVTQFKRARCLPQVWHDAGVSPFLSLPADRLRNVHTHLKPSAVGGILAVVEGDYDYYHYKQDKIDDKVCTCAA